MPKQMSGKTFNCLLDYYIACLEQEDMLAVTFAISSEGTQFMSTPLNKEELFHTGSSEVTLENSRDTQRFFQTSLLRQKQKTLFYGYPVMVCPEGKLSPVFTTEVNYEPQNQSVSIKPAGTAWQLNTYVLQQHGFSSEETLNIKQDIETEEPSNALSTLCAELHLKNTSFPQDLDPKPLRRVVTPYLMNKAILYFGERTDITHNLLVELRQLQKKPLDDLSATSLLLLLTRAFPLDRKTLHKPLLEIFLLNAAQEQAVHDALAKPLTVITGPPGTGKSQVVLNIIANAVYQDKTVLFASKNNKAVDVVIDKLNAILPYKLIVRMGHRVYRKNAKTECIQLMKHQFPIRVTSEEALSEIHGITSQIQSILDTLVHLSDLNKAVEAASDSSEKLREKFPATLLNEGMSQRLDHIDLLLLSRDIQKHFGQRKALQRLQRNRQRNQEECFRKYYDLLPSPLRSLFQQAFITEKTETNTALQWILSLKKVEVLTDEIHQMRKKILDIPDYKTLKNQLLSLHEHRLTASRPVLEQHWMHKLSTASENEKQCVSTYFSASEKLESYHGDPAVFKQLLSEQIRALQQVLKFLPVWVVTNLSAKPSFPLKANLFDILIIDEASQCDIVSAIPLLYRAKRVVIIGDPQQLKHVSLLTEIQDRSLAIHHNLSEEWYSWFAYTKNSLYDLAAHITQTNENHPVLLNEHYRCHSDIISFSNDYYYDRKLMIATNETRLRRNPLIQKHILWHEVKGKTVHAKSPYNEEEAERVVEEVLKILGVASKDEHISLGVVTLFRAQTEIIAEKLKASKGVCDTSITIGTAHRFQGDEKDIILFSPAISEGVKSGTLHWIETTGQLLNVAVTRARTHLIIIGDKEACTQTIGPLHNLAQYVDARSMNTGKFDSPITQTLYDAIIEHGIPVISHYVTQTKTPVQIDIALFMNGSRYAIELSSDSLRKREKILRDDGWKIRQFPEQAILEYLPQVVEEIKRLC